VVQGLGPAATKDTFTSGRPLNPLAAVHCTNRPLLNASVHKALPVHDYFYRHSLKAFFMIGSFRTILLLLAIPVLLFSCKKETETLENVYGHTDYIPLEAGRYVIYHVDSFYWDDFTCTHDTSTMQLRYMVADTFTDNQGRLSYRMDVDIRATPADVWQPHEAVYVTPTAERLEYVQNNLRFIKLISPVLDGATWNGNALINTNNQDLQFFSDWEYTYSNIGDGFDTEHKSYDNTLTVLGTDQALNNPETLPDAYAYRTFAKEVYAKDAGLIYREMTRWTYDHNVKRCLKGWSVVMRAIENN
jgi:hypothetical protein